MEDYAPKRKRWERPGGPCPECGAGNCRTMQSFVCWVRTYKRAMREGDYMRCSPHTRMLRDSGLTILMAPQPYGNEVVYAPTWAVILMATLRQEASVDKQKLRTAQVMKLLRSDHRFGPPAPALLARIDELRAFAVLRGWRYSRGMWNKGAP